MLLVFRFKLLDPAHLATERLFLLLGHVVGLLLGELLLPLLLHDRLHLLETIGERLLALPSGPQGPCVSLLRVRSVRFGVRVLARLRLLDGLLLDSAELLKLPLHVRHLSPRLI